MRGVLVACLSFCLAACLLFGHAARAGAAGGADQAPGADSGDKPAAKTKAKTRGKPAGPSGAAPRSQGAQDKPKPLGKLAAVTRVEQVAGKEYSRIVITLSRETQHHYQLLPPAPKSGDVRRIYVDLDDTRIAQGVPSRLNVPAGLMRKVRVSPYKPGVSRVVVDVENLRAWKVFTLQNPFRVVVDVQGEMPQAAQPERRGENRVKASAGRRSPPAGPAGEAGSEAQAKADAAQEEACAQAEKKRAENPRYKLPAACRKMAKKLVEQLGLTVRTVMIDAGHGGKDPGAHARNGLQEKTVTLRLAAMVGDRLERAGVNVLHTRTADRFVALENRTAMANAKKADLFLSIHCNASPDASAAGLETYSLNLATTPEEVRVAARENAVDPKRISDMRDLLADLMLTSRLSESRDFAKSAHQGAVGQAKKAGPARDRGLHEAPFYVLMGANMPAVLIEVGYITNPAEAEKLASPAYLEKLAQGIADGVLAYKARLDHKPQGQ